jgi:hypothetical protein
MLDVDSFNRDIDSFNRDIDSDGVLNKLLLNTAGDYVSI